ncbi:unnamed protein product, partial [Symbiodinium microadriaticum]
MGTLGLLILTDDMARQCPVHVARLRLMAAVMHAFALSCDVRAELPQPLMQLAQAVVLQREWDLKAHQAESMVERVAGTGSSSEDEYMDVRLEAAESEEEEAAEPEARPSAAMRTSGGTESSTSGHRPVVTEERIVFDRLGQRVREPPGPPPSSTRVAPAADAEASDDGSEGQLVSSGSSVELPPGAPPRGPPPPVPIQYTEAVALRLASAVGQAIPITTGRALVLVPSNWETSLRTQGVTLTRRAMTPGEQYHPHAVLFADDPPVHPAGPEGPRVPGPDEGRTRNDPARRSETENQATATTEETTGEERRQALKRAWDNPSDRARMTEAEVEEFLLDLDYDQLLSTLEEPPEDTAAGGPRVAERTPDPALPSPTAPATVAHFPTTASSPALSTAQPQRCLEVNRLLVLVAFPNVSKERILQLDHEQHICEAAWVPSPRDTATRDFNVAVETEQPWCGGNVFETRTQLRSLPGRLEPDYGHIPAKRSEPIFDGCNNQTDSRERLQLRSPEGAIQTREVEHRQILDYFRALYAGPDYKPVTLSSDVHIEEAEVATAMSRIQATKAMPPDSAPSPLWKLASSDAIPSLTQQFNFYLTAGTTTLPEAWCRSELALLPKPGKSLCHPDQLRPINLLPIQAKLLGWILAMRLAKHATQYLAETHQYAYLPGRSLGQALERVVSHCAQARQLVENQHLNPHARRQGKQSLAVAGGCQLSLDISKAYDRVCWRDLETALIEAGVPQGLVELILLIHHTAVMNVTHCGITGSFSLGRGLRQGCGLAPLLWTIYIGWVLKGLHKDIDPDQTLVDTAYADDLHYSWLVTSGKVLEKAYNQMKAILKGLGERGLQLSMEKTVILMSLGGPQAKACLHRYTVPHPDTKRPCLRFNIGGKQIHLQVVTQQLYLGIQIGYGRFESQTFAHRQQLAKHTNTRLAPVLKCRSLPCQLRLRLWQSTVIPTMLHGLDCVGLPNTTAETMWTQFFKQSRSIANSHSMFTRESNQAFALRLRLPDPIRRFSTGMPECRHCGHKFTTWHSFYNHINTQSCSVLRALKLSPLKAEIMPTLNDAVIENSSIVEFAGQGSWKDLALHPLVQQKHHHCMECNQWHVKVQYVKRHMLFRHPQHRQLIERAEQLAVEGNLSLSNPCQFCGQRYQRKSAHLKACVGVFSGVYLYLRIGRGPKLKALGDDFRHGSGCSGQKMPPGSNEGAGHAESPGPSGGSDGTTATGPSAPASTTLLTSQRPLPAMVKEESQDRAPKFHRPATKGQTGKGQQREQQWGKSQYHRSKGFGNTWQAHRGWQRQGPRMTPKEERGPKGSHDKWDEDHELIEDEDYDIQSLLKMVVMLLLRHESQHCINRIDSGFVVFLRTDVPQSLATSTYQVAQVWHDTKTKTPERLNAPMRAVLMQHLITTVIERMQKMMETPSSRSTAVSLGWLTEDEKAITGLKWNPESRTHVRDEQIKPIEFQEVKTALEELVVLVKEPMVVARYHATRPLSEQYQSPNLTMLMEIGLRSLPETGENPEEPPCPEAGSLDQV